MDKSRVVVAGVLFAMILVACGGGSGTFSTSVPGDRPLNGLSSSEIATLCADAANHIANSGLKQDSCHITGFAEAAYQATSSSNATDAELQAACSQASMRCLTSTTAPNCFVPPRADCTATVAELTACANDDWAQTHALASKVPACSGISRAVISSANSNGGLALALPASCRTYQSKCSSSGGGSTGDGGSGPPDGGFGQ
jgi:hypothetical protein